MSHVRKHLSRYRSKASRPLLAARGRRSLHFLVRTRPTRSVERRQNGFAPPEDWHEPREVASNDYRIVVQPPGPGLRHVLTAEQIRARLSELPQEFVEPLEVVQLSRMTRKKRWFPCYGMQWGNAVYLYPVETNLVEHFSRQPKPAQLVEVAMYGGRWEPAADGSWRLYWTETAIQDYYLNNILIHELGHLVDTRNRSCRDRERYAEWFAIQYGYRPTRPVRPTVRRRHRAT